MEQAVNRFLNSMIADKHATKNTQESYKRDLTYFSNYMKSKNIEFEKIEVINIIMFLNELKKENKSTATLNRMLSVINSFIKYSYQNGYLKRMVTVSKIGMSSSKKEKQVVSPATISKLREILSQNGTFYTRDRIIFELMYTTGLKPSDIVSIKKNDVNMQLGYIKIRDNKGNEELKHIDEGIMNELSDYMKNERVRLANTELTVVERRFPDRDRDRLFLNRSGEMMSRQAIWKSFKKYAEMAGIDTDLTSNVLYESYKIHQLMKNMNDEDKKKKA